MNAIKSKWVALSVLSAVALVSFAPNAEALQSRSVKSPTQVIILKKNAIPRVLGVRQVFTNGQSTTVSGAIVTDYSWGRQTMNARVYAKR